MLLQAFSLRHLRGRLDEHVVYDHFETFEFTQDFPFGVGTPVGSDSWFVYGLDPAPHERTGRRTPAQLRRLRFRPKRAMRGRYVGSTSRVLDFLLPLRQPDGILSLLCDEHTGYPRALASHPQRSVIQMQRYANPERGPKGSPRSPEEIERDRAMFPVDLLHKILRHTLAHHRRETIAFARRINAAMERLFVTAVWRNFVKKRTERKVCTSTPAMFLGLTDARWNWKRVLSRRLFYGRMKMPGNWSQLYCRDWTTPLLSSNAKHRLLRAF
jgi:hypothetical protein